MCEIVFPTVVAEQKKFCAAFCLGAQDIGTLCPCENAASCAPLWRCLICSITKPAVGTKANTRVGTPFFPKMGSKLGPQMTERAQCSESGTIVKKRKMQNFSRVICQNSVLCVCAMKRKIMWVFFITSQTLTRHSHTHNITHDT